MKKILHFLLICTLLFSCNNNENDDLVEDKKIKKITVIDEDFENDSYQLHQTSDFNFSYENNLLTKVYSGNDNYLENLYYHNGILKEIKIKGKDLVTIDRQLYYDSASKLVKVLDINKENLYIKEERFEYPSNDVIIVKYFGGYDINQLIFIEKKKITIFNQNVQKIEFFNGNATVPHRALKFEYDNKINPNSKIDFNRILAAPEMSYAVSGIQDFSQLSKNNVIKSVNYFVYGNTEIFYKKFNITYQYNQDNLPANQSFKVTDSSNTYGFKITANFQY